MNRKIIGLVLLLGIGTAGMLVFNKIQQSRENLVAQTSQPTAESAPSVPAPWETNFMNSLGDLLRGAGYTPPPDSPPAGPVPNPQAKAKYIVRQLFPRFANSITTRVNVARAEHELPLFSKDDARDWLTNFLANFFSGPTGKNICKNLQDVAKFLKEKFGITIRIPS